MEEQTMTMIDESQQIDSTENILQLDDYVSFDWRDGQEISFLNLDRCLRQSCALNHVTNNETILGISLMHNYLLHMPEFVSDYTNLIELNVSHNELSHMEFVLYRPLNKNQLSESYWDEYLKTNSNYPPTGKIYYTKGDICRTIYDLTATSLTQNPDIGKRSKLLISRPLVHPFLERINLSHNHIQSIPKNLHYLRFLHTLNLSHNNLKELPEDIGSLEQLHTLILDHNCLEILPITLTRLSQLQLLNLSHNNFQSIDLIKDFEYLRSFFIDSNPLKFFPELLFTCSNLEEISFSNVPLKQMDNIKFGTFSQYSKLKKLDLSNNNLTDEFFSSPIEQFNYLEELYLQHNQFTTVHSLLSKMKSLNLLDLSYNLLTNIPECFDRNLEILRLSHNKIELYSNECIYLKNIIELNLDHNHIKHIPNEFLQCSKLQSLDLSFNDIENFPKIILQLRSLNKLIMNRVKFHDLTKKDFFDKYAYRTINILNLSNNYLHTNLYQLTGLKALTYLDLSHNQLYELDSNFKVLSCLKILKLNHNKFLHFPSFLCEMSNEENQKYIGENLIELYLNNNKIDLIPEEIVHMITLDTIDLSNNQFLKFPEALIYLEQLTSIIYSQEHGKHINKLPEDFVHFYNLKKLDLSHNIFKDIPKMIYKLTKLEDLNMSYNLLTSIDIHRLKQLKNFKSLKLNGNNFVSFPSALCQLEFLNINDNPRCLAPPNDFIDEKYITATSNLYVQINDQHEEKIFEIYRRIFIEHLTSYDIENLLKRLNLLEHDVNNFRTRSSNLKRQDKIEMLLAMWKDKRGSSANSDTLYKLAKLIGDKNLVQHMRQAYLIAGKIRL